LGVRFPHGAPHGAPSEGRVFTGLHAVGGPHPKTAYGPLSPQIVRSSSRGVQRVGHFIELISEEVADRSQLAPVAKQRHLGTVLVSDAEYRAGAYRPRVRWRIAELSATPMMEWAGECASGHAHGMHRSGAWVIDVWTPPTFAVFLDALAGRWPAKFVSAGKRWPAPVPTGMEQNRPRDAGSWGRFSGYFDGGDSCCGPAGT
jgi:hypothetical protein